MTDELTPGCELVAAMERELQQTGEEAGQTLEWSAVEAEALEVAAAAADRVGELREVYESELAGEAKPTTLAKLSAELRGLERQKLDALARLKFDPDHLSKVRRAAARKRWGTNGVRSA